MTTFSLSGAQWFGFHCLFLKVSACFLVCAAVQLFLERERAAILAEAKTDDLISEAPKPALDQSGEWKETSGEIQWVAAEPNDSQAETKEGEKKEEEDEELDLNKGEWLLQGAWLQLGGRWQGQTDAFIAIKRNSECIMMVNQLLL